MPRPDDPGGAQQTSTTDGAAQPAPGAIPASDLWDLQASPATLEELASGWRGLQRAATTTQDAVDHAAYRVFADEAWLGDTADRYDGHRQRVTSDVGQLAARAKPVAEALEYLAEVLRVNQELLSQERARLADVPATGSGGELVFHPDDEDQARLVNQAIAAAREIRARVDEALVSRRAVFESARTGLDAISETWKPRAVRVLDLNIGQGKGNAPWDSTGTDHGDIDEVGRIILDSGADVATLQEAFEGDMGRLEEWLEDETGDEWDLHFAAAAHKRQWDDANVPDGSVEPFGNAVLVRRGGDIASSEELPEVTLREDDINPNEAGPFDDPREGRSMEGASIELTDN